MALVKGRSLLRVPQLGRTCSGHRRVVTLRPTSPRVIASFTHQLGHNDPYWTLPNLLLPFGCHRNYATAQAPVSRPKAHTGRTPASKKKAIPTKTVAVESPALVKVTTKNSNPKKSTTKKTTTKKATPKPKTKPKVKPKTKSKAKKVVKKKRKARTLSDKQVTVRAAAKKRAKLLELKKTALEVPKLLPEIAYLIMVVESQTGKPGGIRPHETSVMYKNLSPEERERYNHIANQNKATNHATYQKWILSHTPDQIRLANRARSTLRRLTKPSWRSLHDERQVKRTTSAYSYFLIERFASGDFKGILVADAGKRIAAEWKEMPESEKKRYHDMETQDKMRYVQEMKSVYNIEPNVRKEATLPT